MRAEWENISRTKRERDIGMSQRDGRSRELMSKKEEEGGRETV